MKKKAQALFSFGDPIPVNTNSKSPMQEQLAALARSTLSKLEAEDRYKQRMDALYSNAPMTTPAIWRVHKP